jgi:predicted metalloprotease with PDZ domain
MPYDLTKENYFPTGFVAEGVTTYLGDWFLKKSGVFDLTQYLKEWETILRRHLEKDDQAALSLVESSFDLWLDGYAQAIPQRRVSIYQKGALAAFILDMKIRFKTNHQYSIHTLMRILWEKFGKSSQGYTLADYRQVAEEVYGASLADFFGTWIEGTTPMRDELTYWLRELGLELVQDGEGKFALQVHNPDNIHLKLWLDD